MDINDYREKFIQENSYILVELIPEEIAKIPKSDKNEEYEYLHNKGYIKKDDKYLKKVSSNLSDDEIILLTQIKMLEMQKLNHNMLNDIKVQCMKLEVRLERITVLIIILMIIVIIFK